MADVSNDIKTIRIQKMKKIYIVLVRDNEEKYLEERLFLFMEISKQTI